MEIVESGDHTLYRTQGDNNNAPDNQLVQHENIVAIYDGVTIPYIGYLVNFMQNPLNSALLLIIPGIFLIGYGFYTVILTFMAMDRKTKELTENVPNEN